MSWLFVVESNLSHHFAMQTHVLELSRAINKITNVTLITTTPNDQLRIDSPINHSSIRPYNFKPNNLAQMATSWKFYQSILKIASGQKIDVIYQRATAFGLGTILAARKLSIPLLLEINGAWEEEQALSRKRMPRLRQIQVAPIQYARGLSLEYACRLASQVIVVTPQLINYLSRKGISSEKVSAIPNGVNTEHFTPQDKLISRQKLGLNAESFLIGYVGGLTAWQGVDILIQGLSLIKSKHANLQHANLQSIVIGEGQESQNLKNLVKTLDLEEEIIFYQAQPYQLIPDFIAACDLMVAPKRPLSSGYSTLKVFEYLSCGRPVLASDVAGLQFIEQEDLGYLFAPENAVDLANKIAQFISLEQSARTEMGKKGRNYVLKGYTWDHTAHKILSIVKK